MMNKETFHTKLELVKRQLKDSLIDKLKINLINLIEKEIVKSIEETKQTEKEDITIDIYALLLELINDPISQIHYFDLMSSLCTLDNSADKRISTLCNKQLLTVLKTFIDEHPSPKTHLQKLFTSDLVSLSKLNPEQRDISLHIKHIKHIVAKDHCDLGAPFLKKAVEPTHTMLDEWYLAQARLACCTCSFGNQRKNGYSSAQDMEEDESLVCRPVRRR